MVGLVLFQLMYISSTVAVDKASPVFVVAVTVVVTDDSDAVLYRRLRRVLDAPRHTHAPTTAVEVRAALSCAR